MTYTESKVFYKEGITNYEKVQIGALVLQEMWIIKEISHH